MPVKELELLMNINNLSGESEYDVINHMYFTRNKKDYDLNTNIGMRYQF